MIILLIVLTTIYCLFILILTFAWSSVKNQASPLEQTKKNFFSILIPIRNEEANIAITINSILNNNYDHKFYEIIIINDHSTDNSEAIVIEKFGDHPNIKLFKLDSDVQGKKQAISYAINKTHGGIILCTDGDCIAPQHWISSYNQAYNDNPSLKMIFGGVAYESKNLMGKLLQIEFLGLVGIGAATAKIGIPTMINGANFSYQKKVFQEVKGYEGNEQIPSGDDEFLLRKLYAKYPNDVSFLKDQLSIIKTNPPINFNALFNQRKRWAGKWKLHKDLMSKLIPAAIFLFNLTIIYGLYLSAYVSHYISAIILIKILVDFLFLRKMANFNAMKLNIFNFLLLQIIYPFYVVFFGIASNFGSVTWKNRKY